MDGNAQKETCRAPAPGPDGFVPARPRVVLALAVLVLAGMAGFCLALYHSLTAVRPVDPADYPGAAPEGFRWEAAVSREDGPAPCSQAGPVWRESRFRMWISVWYCIMRKTALITVFPRR